MSIPTIRGVIDRRILVNYRVAPDVLAKLLPPPFRPQQVKGWGMAGICLIRLKQIRPAALPAAIGVRSENAAHRIAVEWDGLTHLDVRAHLAPELPAGSIFGSLAEASAFFERGSVGYSPAARGGGLDGLELRCSGWRVEPLAVDAVESSFFDDPARFPPGSAVLDCALLMREIQHEWRSPRWRPAAATMRGGAPQHREHALQNTEIGVGRSPTATRQAPFL